MAESATKHGLQSGERRQSVFYRKQKTKLQAEIMPDLQGVKRHTSSMLDTMEDALQHHVTESGKDGLELDGEMLDDLVNMCSHTRAYQIILDELTTVINKT